MATYTGSTKNTSEPVYSLSHLNGNANNLMNSAYSVLANQTSGQSYAPYAAQQKEAQARSEANLRGVTGQQINALGFGGTPVGAGMGNATEAAILRSRFDNNLGVEAARQSSMLQGAQASQDYAQTVQRLGAAETANKQADWDYNQSVLGDSNNNWVSWATQNKAGIVGDLREIENNPSFKTDDERKTATDSYWQGKMNSSPEAVQYLAGKLGRQPTAEDFAREFGTATDPANTNPYVMAGNMLREAFPDWPTERIDAISELIATGGITWDSERGELVIGDTAASDAAAIKSGNIKLKDYTFTGGKDGPTYKALLSSTPQWEAGRNTQTVDKKKGTVIHGNDGIGRNPSAGYKIDVTLQNAYKDGTPINIGGTLYYVESASRQGAPSGAGDTLYTLRDPLTGETRRVGSEK